ncbi:TRAP transporter small permease subunit [Sagittula sp. NFXS13]|uniref:TRAP transporter small permease protein n=1 Tax=Sagittula marina TaxID=943940 RepID=A0A7W6GU57_9RHOB|nr:TRAP transporter small permease subunit [Sagittula marina]MBB3987153.1 TRAP-type mannitol/chloroaromatic compound transport system permease small subunit [Sagittula marina]
MIATLEKLTNGAHGIVRITGQIAAWSGLALVLLVAFNVLSRYLFSYGSVALQEAEWHLMAVGALFGMAYGLNQGGEVRVDIAYAKFPPRVQAAIDVVSAVLMTAVALLIAYLSLAYVDASYSINEGSPDPGGLGYRYLLKACLPVAFILLAIQSLAMTGHALLTLLRPKGVR